MSPSVGAAWSLVRAEFEASETVMSKFRATSEITQLNRSALEGRPRRLSRRLRQALVTCDRAWRLTDGRFDPRVLVHLERLGDGGVPVGVRPASDPPAGRGQRIVDWKATGWVTLAEPVDLGGIGKGLALRWATDALRHLGLRDFLIDAGGDIATAGRPPDGGAWRVGIEDAAGGASPVAVIAITDEAVATSSVRRRQWRNNGQVVHHLIDPRTGEPGGNGLLAVTVAGPDPAWAEVWSKTLFLEGRTRIGALARRRGLAAWWITDDGSLEMTPAGRARTLWVASEDR